MLSFSRKRGPLPWLRRLGPDVRGATAVEFALVSVPLFAIVLCALQTALIFFFEQSLQTATTLASRQLMVGSAQTSGLTADGFKSAVCAKVPGVFSCSGLMVDVQSAKTYGALNVAPITITYNPDGSVANGFSYAPGAAGDVVIVRVYYNWPVFGDILGNALANQPGGNHLMAGVAVIKNEPFS